MLPRNVETSSLHCKIVTIYHFLLLNKIDIDIPLLYILGMGELLEFGLEKYNNSILWFLNGYNYFCEKELMKELPIGFKKLDLENMHHMKECIKANDYLTVYYDGRVYQPAADDSIYNLIERKPLSNPDNPLVNNSSLGLVIGYDDEQQHFILNIVDLGGKNITIDYQTFIQNNLLDQVYKMTLRKETNKKMGKAYILNRIMNKLITICDNYLLDNDAYSYDEDRGVYGTSGKSSIMALRYELLHINEKLMIVKNTDEVKRVLNYKLSIMRLFMVKGSDTCFRQELADAISYLHSYYPQGGLNKVARSIKQVGRMWRGFGRSLYNVNSSFYNSQPNKYIKKLEKSLMEIYEAEIEFVTSLKEELKIIASMNGISLLN